MSTKDKVYRLGCFVAVSLGLLQFGCVADATDIAGDAEVTDSDSEMLTNAEAIRVERAALFTMSKYGFVTDNYQFQLSLANIDYAKSVAIVAKGADGNWFEIPASYERSAGNNQEIWGAYTTTKVTQFAVRYTALGQTYWDNNAGNDFTIVGQGANLYHGINVLAGKPVTLSGSGSTLFVSAHVRNLGYSKQVNVTYTTDGWQTVQTAPLGYQSYEYYGYGGAPSPNAVGIEYWNGTLNVGSNASTVDYAVSYAVNGQTYWDNNHGANYRVVRQ